MLINPFKPNSPISPGMYVGRIEEIEKIESALIQTKANQSISFLLLGNRGIGKTSLLSLVKYLAEGKIEVQGQRLKYLVLETDIAKETTQIALIRKIEVALRRKLANTEKARKVFGDIWSFIKRLEVAGVKYNSKEQSEELLFEEFSYSIADTINRITADSESPFDEKYEGVLILIDEADNASDELNLGSFVKTLTERLQREGTERLLFGIAGLPKLKDILYRSHPSSLRIFMELYLDKLSNVEVKEVISMVLRRSKEINHVDTTIEQEAEEFLIKMSEGYPHFIQQYGYCAFERSDGKSISISDVAKGAFGENGAIEAIGNRYYRDDYFNKIQGENYRQVLNIMAESPETWVTRKEIKSKFSGTESTLKNAISALLTRNIILPQEGNRGSYRLQDKGFALWILMNREKEKQTQGY